jgi:hypothetical protein
MVLCILLLTSALGLSPDSNNLSDISVADSTDPANDSNGPTILLSYSIEGFKKNPISSFMYFVPLISPTLVDRQTSANNEQQVGIISYERKVTSKSFNVVCEFLMRGKGFHKNAFEPNGVIAIYIGELKEGETLTNMLDYIKFEGDGFGRIEVKGTFTGSVPTVTEVDLKFDAKDRKSPVTVGLYDIEPKDGRYKYENRSNQRVARVNELSFKRTAGIPRMGVKVASISRTPDSEGLFSRLKGVLANLFLRPPEVTKLGNKTMLDFGYTLLKHKPSFTFPKAANIKENIVVEGN